MKFLCSFAIIFLLQFPVSANHTANFNSTDIEEAKAIAGSLGKLAFVKFYADWCSPCKWMDQTTFSNPSVSTFLSDNYISVKVNIDDFDGFSAKEFYKVKSLPTMLIFNSKGQLVERIEETLAPSKLMSILESHNSEANKIVIQNELNSAPSKKYHTTSTSYKTVNQVVRPHRQYAITPVKPSTHRVLVGTFRDPTSAHNYHNVLKQTFLDPIFIIKDVAASQVIYKVMMGEFQTKSEAQDYQRILASQFEIKGSVE